MIVHVCDKCKKKVSRNEIFTIGDQFGGVELCPQCAMPIVRLIKSKELLPQGLVSMIIKQLDQHEKEIKVLKHKLA